MVGIPCRRSTARRVAQGAGGVRVRLLLHAEGSQEVVDEAPPLGGLGCFPRLAGRTVRGEGAELRDPVRRLRLCEAGGREMGELARRYWWVSPARGTRRWATTDHHDRAGPGVHDRRRAQGSGAVGNAKGECGERILSRQALGFSPGSPQRISSHESSAHLSSCGRSATTSWALHRRVRTVLNRSSGLAGWRLRERGAEGEMGSRVSEPSSHVGIRGRSRYEGKPHRWKRAPKA